VSESIYDKSRRHNNLFILTRVGEEAAACDDVSGGFGFWERSATHEPDSWGWGWACQEMDLVD
jgi:hypothetical protein